MPAPRGYAPGIHRINRYPYLVENGLLYRASVDDVCHYQLVDRFHQRVEKNYGVGSCYAQVNRCRSRRNQLNDHFQRISGDIDAYRYECYETFQGDDFWNSPDHGQPTSSVATIPSSFEDPRFEGEQRDGAHILIDYEHWEVDDDHDDLYPKYN